MDTQSGKDRKVITYLDVKLYAFEPEATVLSEWLGESSSEPNWQTTAKDAGPFIRVDHYYPHLEPHVQAAGEYLRSDELRRAYSQLVLEELKKSKGLAELLQHCKAMNEAMEALKFDSNIEINDEAMLIGLWKSQVSSTPQS